jgi:phosphoglycerate dehydrogenase-like enzyme
MASRPVVAFLVNSDIQRQILDGETTDLLKRLFEVRWPSERNHQVTAAEAAELLRDADGCLTSWGSPPLTKDLLDRAPRLRIMSHAGGSVKSYVSDEVWRRKITVTSGSGVIAVDVAHFAIALMVIGRKNMMELAAQASAGEWTGVWGHRPPDDLRGCTVGIVSAGHVGRKVIELLKPFETTILLYDPYVTADEARALGATRVEITDLFRRSDVVSLHAPSLKTTRHLVNAARLALMKNGAILINTARGSLVDEAALIHELKKRRIWAFLDVTDPEPPPPGSPLFSCPNLTLTPHIAGSIGRGRRKIGDHAIEELRRFFAGEPPLYPVSEDALERLA